MSEHDETYGKLLEALREQFENFMDEAEKGKEGRGSKTCALKARKISSQMANMFKDFRALSIANDKAKPVQTRETTAEPTTEIPEIPVNEPPTY